MNEEEQNQIKQLFDKAIAANQFGKQLTAPLLCYSCHLRTATKALDSVPLCTICYSETV